MKEILIGSQIKLLGSAPNHVMFFFFFSWGFAPCLHWVSFSFSVSDRQTNKLNQSHNILGGNDSNYSVFYRDFPAPVFVIPAQKYWHNGDEPSSCLLSQCNPSSCFSCFSRFFLNYCHLFLFRSHCSGLSFSTHKGKPSLPVSDHGNRRPAWDN